jgi:hypothetical protein
LITAKVHRALHGRDEPLLDDEDRVQNDWNGSAKVALISMERSEAAWRSIAHATSDADAEALAGLLHGVREETLTEFPDALRFTRPGFDEPAR